MKSHLLLKENIDALLRARGQKRKELAFWCKHDESWLSQIMRSPKRGFPFWYLDRIAEFFGIPHVSTISTRHLRIQRAAQVEGPAFRT